MPRKSRIIRLIKSSRSSSRNYHFFRPNHKYFFFFYRKSNRAINFPVLHKQIRNIKCIQNSHIFYFFHSISKYRLEIFSIYFYISISTCDIFSIFILQNYKSQFFHFSGNLIKSIRSSN